MKRTIILAVFAFLFVFASLAYFFWFESTRAEQKQTLAATEKDRSNIVAAPGIIESASEEIEVSAEIPGKLREVLVEEGDRVTMNQVIAILENSDLTAQVQTAKTSIETLRRQQETAKARLAAAEADKLRIVNGARLEERREARAGYEQTLAALTQSERDLERRSKLYAAGDISREEFERARRDFEIAQKRNLEINERYNVINAAARTDDLMKAEATIKLASSQIQEILAQIAEAEARVREAEARLSKTIVLAPISGVVLRRRRQAGESFSPENSSDGIVTIGDVSNLKVRAEVDETDVAKIKVGQMAYATADAFGAEKFRGRVVRINQILGRKNFRTERPTEKVDTKILEVLIELEPNQKLPVGLRVDTFIGEE